MDRKLFSKSIIDKKIKPELIEDLQSRDEEEIISLLKFHSNNCLNSEFINSSYNYSYSRACIDIICEYTELNIPDMILINDKDRDENPSKYYKERKRYKAKVKSKKKAKSKTARRVITETEPDDGDVMVVTEVRSPNRPSVAQILKFNNAFRK